MTFLNFTDPRFWIDLFQIVGMVVIALVLFARRPGEEAAKANTALTERVVILEHKIANVPTSEEMAELVGMINVIEEQGKAMSQRMDGLSIQLNRMETFLLTRGKP